MSMSHEATPKFILSPKSQEIEETKEKDDLQVDEKKELELPAEIALPTINTAAFQSDNPTFEDDNTPTIPMILSP